MSLLENHLPIIEVTDENISMVWPLLQQAIGNASFVAIDTEMSGLGDRKRLCFPEIDVRYKYMAELARSHALLSLGLSCYSCTEAAASQGSTDRKLADRKLADHYQVQTFDVLVMSQSSFSVESDSLKFLRSHDFDFNRQIEHGLLYKPGNDPQVEITSPTSTATTIASTTTSKASRNGNDGKASSFGFNINSEESNSIQPFSARNIFSALVGANKPLVLHNGLVDLTFLYQHLYAQLPSNLETFAADLNDLFPLGIYDTKYFSEFIDRDPATYLQFVYMRSLLDNETARQQHVTGHVLVSFPAPSCSPTPGLQYFRHQRGLHFDPDHKHHTCSNYAHHGWCNSGDSCSDSHNVRRIVQELLLPAQRIGKRGRTRGSSGRAPGAPTSGPRTTGTSAMLQSALKHNARHTLLNKKAKLANQQGSIEAVPVIINHDSAEKVPNKICMTDTVKQNGIDERTSSLPLHKESDDEKNFLELVDETNVSKPVIDLVCNTNGTSSENSSKDGDSECSINGCVSGTIDSLTTNTSSTQDMEVSSDGGSLNKVSVMEVDSRDVKTDSISSRVKNGCCDSGSPITPANSSSLVTLSESTSDNCNRGAEGNMSATTSGESSRDSNPSPSTCEGHSAGFDAFMTGFIFAWYVARQQGRLLSGAPSHFSPSAVGLQEHVNKVFLMTKNFPFLVRRSPFSKLSKNHMVKIKRIRE